ncbi:MAG: hypothetical protein V4610_19560 [Pseudomonadota bacterium]
MRLPESGHRFNFKDVERWRYQGKLFMSFQPFGYRFEVRSPHSPVEVTTAIRSRKKGWLDPKNGARGWIAGPFICLWFSVFDQNGPMLFGVVSNDGTGTRVHGRAGSDLNGVVMLSLLIPLIAFIAYEQIAEGSASLRQLLFVAVVFLFGGPLIYWFAHKDRKEAEPLVRFIRDAATSSGRTLRRNSAAMTISKGLAMSVGGERLMGVVRPSAIHDALIGVGVGSFVILESGSETYIQTASRKGGYAVEKREGDSRQHFRAVRRSNAPNMTNRPDDIFEFEEVREIFMAYASETPAPRFVSWERMHLTE